MLKIMRKKNLTRNLILAIIIFALASYVLVSFGRAPIKAQGDSIARIGDTTLKVKDLKLTLKNINERYSQLDPKTIHQIAASTVVNDAIMKNASHEMGIVVSNDELRDYIIQFRKGFSEEGKYITKQQWADWIRFNFQMSVNSFENYLKENDLQLSSFRSLFSHAAVVTENEIKKEFTNTNQSMDAEYATLNQNMFRSELDLSDKNVKAQYEKNPQGYQTGPQRKIQYVLLTNDMYKGEATVTDDEVSAFYEERKDKPPYFVQERVHAKHILIKPVDSNKEAALAKIQKIRKEIENGLSFEDAAKKYSQDTANAGRGGDLGVSTRDRWDPAFANAAFALEVDAISQPVESSFGYHLIKVVERFPEKQQTFEEAKDQIKEQLLNRAARDLAREKAKEFQEQVQISLDLEAQAKAFNVEVAESNFFDEDPQTMIDSTIQKNVNLARQIFSLKNLNDISGNIDIGRGVVIAKWIAEEGPQPLDWEKDQARIKTQVEKNLASSFLEDLVAKAKKQLEKNPEATLTDLLKSYSFVRVNDIKSVSSISKNNPPTALGAKNLTFDELYKASKGDLLGPLDGRFDRQFVIVHVTNKIEPDFEKFADQKEDIKNRLKQRKGFELMINYLFTQKQILDPNNQTLAHVQQVLENQ